MVKIKVNEPPLVMEDGPIMQNIRKGPIKVARFLQSQTWRRNQEKNKLIKLNWKETKGIPGNKAIKKI
tara:strand:- start:56 stop:259 length:204 start_codon:yes stop_codon:yes gene_type:complete